MSFVEAKLKELKAGDVVYTDAGFTCLDAGKHHVHEDEDGLYIKCDEGRHYLEGQINDHGTLSGVSHTPYPDHLVAEVRQRP